MNIIKKYAKYISFLIIIYIKKMLIDVFDVGRGPDFMIIGAQKAGTTSLFEYIRKYAQNFKPPLRKETRFFTSFYHKGISFYKAFFPFSGKCITGEATPMYLYYAKCPKRISSVYPNMKIIILLRNPIDRAYSQYNFIKYSDKTYAREDLSFSDAISHEEARIKQDATEEFTYNNKHYSYVAKGLYYEQIKRWLQYYPRENLFILESEHFFNNPRHTLNEVSKFLGLQFKIPDTTNFKIHNKNIYQPMSPEIRKMLSEYYRPHNRKLFKLLERTFNWD